MTTAIAKRKRVLRFNGDERSVMVDNKLRRIGQLLQPGDTNTKLRKNAGQGYLTCALSLSPANEAGVGAMCYHFTVGCEMACLEHQGLASVFSAIRASRVAKTVAWRQDRKWFAAKLAEELSRWESKAARESLDLCFRGNVFSDVPWEVKIPWLFERFSAIQFYDYTKNPRRTGLVRPNYWVTFSRSERNHKDCLRVLSRGNNVAVVFHDGLPHRWHGFDVIDGDESDLRFEDPRGVVVGLKLKAATLVERAKAIDSGFAISQFAQSV